MKQLPTLVASVGLMFCAHTHAQSVVTLASTSDSGWAMLSPLSGANGYDPATTDTDFNSTWHSQSFGSYTGVGYDGPAFTSNLTGPFEYGGVDGVPAPFTTIPQPSSGSRGSAYFLKEIDGGTTGFDDIKLSMVADDGAYIYLNGQLVATINVPTSVANDTWGQLSNSVGSETNVHEIVISGSQVIKPGSNLLAVSMHNQSMTSSDLGFTLELTNNVVPSQVTLASTTDSDWSMLHPLSGSAGYDPATVDADFNSTWHSQSLGVYSGTASYDGPTFTNSLTGPFAYGGVDGIPSPGTAMATPTSGTRGAAYFMKVVDGGATGYDDLELSMVADDGAYVYLNGELVASVNVPTAPANDTWSQLSNSVGSETALHTIVIPGYQVLKPGPNLLAVSLHNQSMSSSDLGFTLELKNYLADPSVTRGPYLQKATNNSMTVRWRTGEAGTSTVRYGDSPTNLAQSVTINESVTEHEVTITGLSPNTKYYYEVETVSAASTITAGAASDYYFTTHPNPGTTKAARVWVIGDSGTTSQAKQNVYDAYRNLTGSAQTDAWLMLGDNAYNDGTDAEFQAAVFDAYPELLRNTVLWSCIGNHETYTSAGQPYIDLHSFPMNGESGGVASGSERYYSFDYGNIHFVCLDSQTSGNYNDVPGSGGMIDWLELDLQATDADWIIAYFHHGPYDRGSHNSDTESHHIVIRQYVVPILEQYGCDLVLSGHSHAYERSMLINGHHSNMTTANSDSSTFNYSSHVVDGGNGSTLGSVDGSGNFLTSGADGAYQKPVAQGEAGTVYTVAGASGKVSAWYNGSTATVNPDPNPVHIVTLRVMGSIVLDINGNTLNFQYIDQNGQVRDDFSIHKYIPANDSDTDGLDDTWEITHFGSITAQSGSDDADGDGLTNAQEYAAGTDPNLIDSDGDSYSDYEEVNAGTDPNNASSYPAPVALVWTGAADNDFFNEVNWDSDPLTAGTQAPSAGTVDDGQALGAPSLTVTGAAFTGVGYIVPDGSSLTLNGTSLVAGGTTGFNTTSSAVSALNLNYGANASFQFIAQTTVTLDGNAVLELRGSGNPVNGSTIDLVSTSTASIRFTNETIASVQSEHLSKITVDGVPAVEEGNVTLADDNGVTVLSVISAMPAATVQWNLNDGSGTVVSDSSGNANNGTITSATWTSSGVEGNALDFDGVNDRVDAGLTSGSQGAFTVALWVKSGANGQNIYSGVLSSYNPNTSGTFQIDMTNGFTYRGSQTVSFGAAPLGEWVHLVVSCDGINTKLYYDGQLVQTLSGVADDLFNGIHLGVNRNQGNFFQGSIDELRFYNESLSDIEVGALYGSYN